VSNPFDQVPVLPVVIPLGVALFVVLVLGLRARRLLSLPRVAVAAALSIYVAGIVANTIFPIFLDAPGSDEPWTPSVALLPFVDYEVEDALINVAVFVPLGALIPLLVARPRWRTVLAISAGASLAIELLQLAAQRFFGGGHIADINDFIFNVVGAALGYVLFLLVVRSSRGSALVDRFRWAATADIPGSER
jgi:glycopeptide antibiotics resistance protein